MVWSWGLCVRFAGCCSKPNQTKAPNTTGNNLLYNTLEFLMMGIMVPETCWASNKICNKNHLLHLVSILLTHISTFHLLFLVKYKKSEYSCKKVGKPVHYQSYIKLPQNCLKILSGSCEQLVGFPLFEECQFKHKSITAELALFLLINLRFQPLMFLSGTSSFDN